MNDQETKEFNELKKEVEYLKKEVERKDTVFREKVVFRKPVYNRLGKRIIN